MLQARAITSSPRSHTGPKDGERLRPPTSSDTQERNDRPDDTGDTQRKSPHPKPRKPTTALSKQRPDSLLIDWERHTLSIMEFTRPYDSHPRTLRDTDLYKRAKYEQLRRRIQQLLPVRWTCQTVTFTVGVRGTAFNSAWLAALRAINIPDPPRQEDIIRTAVHASLTGLDSILQARAAHLRRQEGSSPDS